MKKLYVIFVFSFFHLLNIQGQISECFRPISGGSGIWNAFNVCDTYLGSLWMPITSGYLPTVTIGTNLSKEENKTPFSPDKYPNVLPSTITVGTKQNYETLTGVNGLFAALNAGSISSNTEVIIKSNIQETGDISLNEVKEEGPYAGTLTITIRSDGRQHSIFGMNIVKSNPLISINGADRLTIDGGTGKYLTFRNTGTIASNTLSVFQFTNSAQNNILTNCIIESNYTSITYGAIDIGSTGFNSVTISQNEIRDSRGVISGSPLIGISSNSSGNTLNIINNNIYNLNNINSFGIKLKQLANDCNITGNSIYMESEIASKGTFTGIYIEGSNNFNISNNYIGGSAPKCQGSAPFKISGNTTFAGIYTFNNSEPKSIIEGNIISNITMTSNSTPVFIGIYNESRPINIIGNIIGSASVLNSIQISGTGASTGIIQNYPSTLNNCSIEKNTIANIRLTNGTGSPIFNALKMTGGKASMNNIFNIGSEESTLTPKIYGINNCSGFTNNEFSNNVISLNGGASTNPCLYGFYDDSQNGSTGFYYNSINIYGTTTGENSTFAYYCFELGTYILSNNILVNSRTGTGNHYGIYSNSNSGFTSDFNNLFVCGTTLGHWGETGVSFDIKDLAAWRTATNQDTHSISTKPLFTSPLNLLPLDSSAVIGSGINILAVTKDINGKIRHEFAPTIGAYELVCVKPINGGTIGKDQMIWNSTPELITNVTSASGFAGRLEYKWQNSVPPDIKWKDISSSNTSDYQPGNLTQSTMYKRLSRTTCMNGWSEAVESNVVTITISINKWKGNLSTEWNNPANWLFNKVPSENDNVVFDNDPLNHCVLDQNRTVNDITNHQSTYFLNTNGKILTVKGNLNFTNGAQIDATSPNSTVVLSGTTFQSIPSKIFVKDRVYSLTIDNAYGVSPDSDIIIDNLLTINSGKQLIIPTGTLIDVKGIINNKAGTSGLIIKAGKFGNVSNGSVIFHNDASKGSYVPATVEMYTKAAKVGGHNKWQFFGIPLKSIQANPTFNGSYVREMHENVSGITGHWVQLQNESILSSFRGYEISQDTEKIISFKGDLENIDFKSGELSFTLDATYKGQHLIGNPYAAAINFKKDSVTANSIAFGDGMFKTVYIYNTGSKEDWETNGLQGTGIGDKAGQYLAIPQENAGNEGLPSSIPSMQAFLVMVNTLGPSATISIPYSTAGTIVKNTTSQHARVQDKICTRIEVYGSYFGDCMWIFTEPTCTRGYDNGWDGYKIMGSNLSPQIYAMEADGNYQVNSVDAINCTYLGFKAGIDSIYTMNFTHQNKDSRYSKLYLLDLSENKTTDITATGSQYTFNSNSGLKVEKRFKIITTLSDTTVLTNLNLTQMGGHSLFVYSSKNTIVVNNQSKLKGYLYIYNIAGYLITKLHFDANDITTFPIILPAGTYFSKAVTLIDDVKTIHIFHE